MPNITWLADVLRAAGCEVREEPGWETAGRPTGGFDPIGVLWHHTVARSSASNPAPSLTVVKEGRPNLPGPLCHALIDYNGVFRLIAAGRANHAGDSGGSGPIPAGDGNELLVGWEIDYHGVEQDMTPAQYDAAVMGTAAVLRRLGRSAEYARGHRETSVTGKIDPGGIDLDDMRRDVAAELRGSGGGGAIATSGVSAVVYDNVLRVLATGTDEALWNYQWNGSTWSWQSLAGRITSGPSAAVHGPVLRVFARGADNSLWQDFWNGSAWTWQALNGAITSAPAAVVFGNTLRVYARGADGALWQNTWNGSTWTWQDLGFPITSGPAAVVWNNQVRVFGRGTDGALWQHILQGSNWVRQKLGGQITSAPSAVVHGTALRVFGRGSDGALWQNTWDGSAWTWQDLAGQITGAPSAVVHGTVLRVFGRGTDGALWQNYRSGSSWTWQKVGGTIV